MCSSPEPKVERFYFFQKFWNKTITFDVLQLLAKAKRYYLIQKIFDLKENVLVR